MKLVHSKILPWLGDYMGLYFLSWWHGPIGKARQLYIPRKQADNQDEYLWFHDIPEFLSQKEFYQPKNI